MNLGNGLKLEDLKTTHEELTELVKKIKEMDTKIEKIGETFRHWGGAVEQSRDELTGGWQYVTEIEHVALCLEELIGNLEEDDE